MPTRISRRPPALPVWQASPRSATRSLFGRFAITHSPSLARTTRSAGSKRSGFQELVDSDGSRRFARVRLRVVRRRSIAPTRGASGHLQRPSRGRSGARMSDWQQIIKDQSIATLEKLADKFGHDAIDVEALKPAFDNFQMRITPAALEQIKEVGDPMWNQYIPTVDELNVVDGVIDSLDEDGDSPVPNITHRYPDRALFLVSPVCATYCRFCTRRRKVGDPEKIPMSQFESAFRYLEQHTEIRDVIMSGGDPLLLSDRRLDQVIGRLRQIPHLEIIRIGSRIPCHLPERITPELCAILKKYHPFYINTHFNHPDELTPAAVRGLAMLADAGIPLGCQTVLLKGVNDDAEVMKELMQRLLV